MSCPKCQSDDWKSASFVHKSGISDINLKTSTIGAGAGVGTGGLGAGIGMGSSYTNGTQQSRMSMETAPPEEPKNNAGTIYWAISILAAMAIANKHGDLIGWIVIIVAFLIWFGFIKAHADKTFDKFLSDYKRKLARWEATRICQRCGQLYFSEDFVESDEIENQQNSGSLNSQQPSMQAHIVQDVEPEIISQRLNVKTNIDHISTERIICQNCISEAVKSESHIGISASDAGGISNQEKLFSKQERPPIKVYRPAQTIFSWGVVIIIILLIFARENLGIYYLDSNPIPNLTFFISLVATLVASLRLLFTPKITEQWNEKNKLALLEYEKKKMCVRCGSTFLDGENQAL